MHHAIISKDEYLKMASLLDWFTREQAVVWFTGNEGRHKRTEAVLPLLVQEGKLRTVTYGKRLVYTHTRNGRGRETPEGHIKSYARIAHGLGVTECLVRFRRSTMDSEVLRERHFRGCGILPDFALRFPAGKMAGVEFTTADNHYKKGNMTGKLRRYRKNIEQIEARFKAEFFAVFVVDIRREKIAWFVERANTAGPFFFCDYETFRQVPYGQQLTAPIYIWGGDGKEYRLKRDA